MGRPSRPPCQVPSHPPCQVTSHPPSRPPCRACCQVLLRLMYRRPCQVPSHPICQAFCRRPCQVLCHRPRQVLCHWPCQVRRLVCLLPMHRAHCHLLRRVLCPVRRRLPV